MNCKQGDLAVVINQTSRNYGRFVTVLRPRADGEFAPGSKNGFDNSGKACWIVEAHGAPLQCSATGPMKVRPMLDSSLRPIRPQRNDAQDETLSWLPVPHKEHA